MLKIYYFIIFLRNSCFAAEALEILQTLETSDHHASAWTWDSRSFFLLLVRNLLVRNRNDNDKCQASSLIFQM
jgi:hypothetical protein